MSFVDACSNITDNNIRNNIDNCREDSIIEIVPRRRTNRRENRRNKITIKTENSDTTSQGQGHGQVQGENELSEKDTNILQPVIFRFKFTEDFMIELYNFSKIHQYDHRKDFKEAWTVWTKIEENELMIDEEINRLSGLGYVGDVMDKMFKSARYYFRKKSDLKKEPKQRRDYISVNRELLDSMDIHIEENIQKIDYQPKDGFIQFCKENESVLRETIGKMCSSGVTELDVIKDKIKKTYKNRYFMFINNCRNK